MREIKFRAWDKGLSNDDNIPMMTQALTIQEWLDQRGFYYVNGYQANLSDFDWKNELIFLQYTGLKDKNGVEIYEGDILKVRSYAVTGLGKVGFNKGSFVFNKFEYPTSTVLHSFSEIEVIGNIYENPELLENR